MSQVLKICQLGHSVLRQVAQPVENILDPQVQILINHLISTVSQANGVGIAAPQVAQSYRLFIVASRPNLRYPQAPIMEPTAMINPKIVAHSQETVKGWEGCLSVPGIRGLVSRSQSVEVEYFNQEGEQCRQFFADFVARIFQHELDHLDGIVFLDRVETTQDLISEEEFQKQIIAG
jgi:peptide deformylase